MMLLRPSGLLGGVELPFLKQLMPPLRAAAKTPEGAKGGQA
jgi:hypothetical protein